MELSRLTTLGLGGPARTVVEPGSIEETCAAVEAAESLLVLGGGSNLVVADAGFGGTVVRLGRQLARTTIERGAETALVIAEAGVWFDDLVAESCEAGLAGLEALSGIPGSVGATPMQNVGAYGREIAEVLRWVEVWDRREKCIVQLDREACAFGYRSSRFRHDDRFVILRVALDLHVSREARPVRYAELAKVLGGERAPLEAVRRAVLQLRRQKGMVVDADDPDSRSCGSFFTNPIVSVPEADRVQARAGTSLPRFPAADRVKLSAAWLIERAGFGKGWGDGQIGVSRKHSLALVNRGHGTTAELLEVARAIRTGVRAAWGVTLEPEPIFVGCAL